MMHKNEMGDFETFATRIGLEDTRAPKPAPAKKHEVLPVYTVSNDEGGKVAMVLFDDFLAYRERCRARERSLRAGACGAAAFALVMLLAQIIQTLGR